VYELIFGGVISAVKTLKKLSQKTNKKYGKIAVFFISFCVAISRLNSNEFSIAMKF